MATEASKSNFWQCFNLLYKEIYLILRSEKIVFIIKGFNLVLGFPDTKYPPNTKNYLPCLLLGGTFCIREKGLFRFHTKIVIK